MRAASLVVPGVVVPAHAAWSSLACACSIALVAAWTALRRCARQMAGPGALPGATPSCLLAADLLAEVTALSALPPPRMARWNLGVLGRFVTGVHLIDDLLGEKGCHIGERGPERISRLLGRKCRTLAGLPGQSVSH